MKIGLTKITVIIIIFTTTFLFNSCIKGESEPTQIKFYAYATVGGYTLENTVIILYDSYDDFYNNYKTDYLDSNKYKKKTYAITDTNGIAIFIDTDNLYLKEQVYYFHASYKDENGSFIKNVSSTSIQIAKEVEYSTIGHVKLNQINSYYAYLN